jgi:hypothetical protein
MGKIISDRAWNLELVAVLVTFIENASKKPIADETIILWC